MKKFWHRIKPYYILQVHKKETNETINIGIFKTYKKADKFDKELFNELVIDTNKYGLTCSNEPIDAPDLAHYDSLSQLRLGNLFAEELIKFFK